MFKTSHKLHTKLVPAAIALLVFLVASVSAQECVAQRKVVTAGGGGDDQPEMFFLHELGALITPQEDGLTIEMVLSADQRQDEYKEIDLKEGDVIKMMNGKRMSGVPVMQEAYDALEVGDEIKLGIKRGQSLQIVTFARGDSEGAPRVMMMTAEMPDGADGHAEGQDFEFTSVQVSGPDGKAMNVTPLMGLGLMLKDEEGQVVVDMVMPGAFESNPDNFPVTGDVIQKIQGEEVTSAQQAFEIYEKIAVKADMTITVSHEGNSVTSTFAKPKGMGGAKVIKKSN